MNTLITILSFLVLSCPSQERAIVRCLGSDHLVERAAEVLKEELSTRKSDLKVTVGLEKDIDAPELDELPPTGAEGFKICRTPDGVIIAGHDPRGVLFGVGKLLRMEEPSNLSSTPKNPYRTHSFNPSPRFNDKTDRSALEQLDRKIRDVALFGTNGIQLLRNSPREYFEIVHSWGLDVWVITFDNSSPEVFRSPEGFKRELEFRRNLIRGIPYCDHYIMKSGDPGDLQIDEFFNFSSQEAQLVRNRFPDVNIWVVPQHFKDAPVEYFTKAIEYANKSPWVSGVCSGCWTRLDVEQVRGMLNPEIPLMLGPDITHIYSNMLPARNMDLALARSLGRICIDISPETQKHIHNLYDSFNVGSQCYSEGTTDDLHKCIWSALEWEPGADVREIVREYARLYIPGTSPEKFAEGVMAIERNAIGPLEKAVGMPGNLELWRGLHNAGNSENVRFLMPYLRAAYDAYIYKRYSRDLLLEREAYSILATAPGKAGKIAGKARKVLKSCNKCVDPELRDEIQTLYRKTYRDEQKWTAEYQPNNFIGQMELSLVDDRYINWQLDIIGGIEDRGLALEKIRELGSRYTDMPGKVYFNLGDFSTESISGIDAGWPQDPAYLHHPVRMFGCAAKKFTISGDTTTGQPAPRSWLTQAGVYYDQPMTLTFSGLEPGANYKVKVVYAGEVARAPVHIRMHMGEQLVHGPVLVATEVEEERPLPAPASPEGDVTLRWQCSRGERGVAVAEITFIKQ